MIVLITLAIYWPVTGHQFVDLDDYSYVLDNPHINTGLTLRNFQWAFSSLGYESNWHPLTWLSHMGDVEFYGLNPRGHHLTSILLHAVGAAVLFVVLYAMTGALWASAFLTGLFVLHPLHVESVAWVSERKDVLSALFWFLALGAYLRYVRQPGALKYALMALCFALSLLSKPMAVTFPLALLLLDFWPLGRLPLCGCATVHPTRTVLLEKVPLLGLSAASALVTFVAQTRGGAVAPQDVFAFSSRLANAPVAYVMYILNMFWPSGLAVLYPHPGNGWVTWKVATAVLFLVIASSLSIRLACRAPYVLVGYFWFLGTLVPVIGLVQVGGQALADRYTYVPLLGLFLVVTWSVGNLPAWRMRTLSLTILAISALAALGAGTRYQLGLWKDSVTLFSHAIEVTQKNAVAHYCLGNALSGQGDLKGAEYQYREALKVQPSYANAHNDLGAVLFQQGRYSEALSHYQEALRANPRYFSAYNNMGIILRRLDRPADALDYYRRALQLEPDSPGIYYNIGLLLYGQGKRESAIDNFSAAIALAPLYWEAYNRRGRALQEVGRLQEAEADFGKALEIKAGKR